jgi:hypothetical protein
MYRSELRAGTIDGAGARLAALLRRSERPRRPVGFLDEPDDDAANFRTASLGGVAITLLLLVVSLFLVRELHAQGMVDDCLRAEHVTCELPMTQRFGVIAGSPERFALLSPIANL